MTIKGIKLKLRITKLFFDLFIKIINHTLKSSHLNFEQEHLLVCLKDNADYLRRYI